jgi:hypothetical protein
MEGRKRENQKRHCLASRDGQLQDMMGESQLKSLLLNELVSLCLALRAGRVAVTVCVVDC